MTTFEIYKDAKGETRWRAKRKGRVVADSAEGYKRKGACLRSLNALLGSVRTDSYAIKFQLG